MDPMLVAFAGYLVGCFFLTLYDFLWKIIEDPELSFEKKYLMSMLASLGISVITAFATFIQIPLPKNGQAWIFFSSLTYGFTVNHVVNKGVSYWTRAREK